MKLFELYNQLIKEDTNRYPPIPDVLYHGQPPKYDNRGVRTEPVKFDKFNQNFKRFLGDANYGFYFTPSKSEATKYAEGGNVYVCKVNIKNPYYYENEFAYTNNGLINIATFIKEKDKQKLIENGYDGIVLLDIADNIGEVIALYPEQIEILEIIN